MLFFNTLADDLILAHGNLLKFCGRIDEVERLDEAHLLPLALEIFGVHHFTQSGRYISVKKNAKSVTGIVAKRLNFDSYYCVDHNEDWGEIHYTFGEDDYDVAQYVYADKKGDSFFASAGEWIVYNANRKHFAKHMIIHISQD